MLEFCSVLGFIAVCEVVVLIRGQHDFSATLSVQVKGQPVINEVVRAQVTSRGVIPTVHLLVLHLLCLVSHTVGSLQSFFTKLVVL